MAWIGSVLNIVGAAVGVAGGVADGQAAQGNRAYQAKVEREGLRIADAGNVSAEEQVRRESRQVLAVQRAAVAESGGGFGGSHRLLMAQDAALAELDALNVRHDGALNRWETLARIQALETRPPSIDKIFGSEGYGKIGRISTSIMHPSWGFTSRVLDGDATGGKIGRNYL